MTWKHWPVSVAVAPSSAKPSMKTAFHYRISKSGNWPDISTMLCKRIIPCLDIKDGRTVKGTNFLNLRDAGDPVELGALYAREGADELVFLDITATVEKRKTFSELV